MIELLPAPMEQMAVPRGKRGRDIRFAPKRSTENLSMWTRAFWRAHVAAQISPIGAGDAQGGNSGTTRVALSQHRQRYLIQG